MEKIVLLLEVIFQLNKLVNILYDNEYFGFIESAFEYADNIYNFIFDIPNKPYKKAYNNKLGVYYSSYKANNNTTWYILFDVSDNKFIIQNIINNHSSDYAYVISLLK